MTYQVEIKEVASQPLAAVRFNANARNIAHTITTTLSKVWAFIKARQLPHLGINVVLYHPTPERCDLFSDEGIAMEAAVQVAQPFEGEGEICLSQTPAGKAAATTHLGPYHKLVEAHAAILAWCAEHDTPFAAVHWRAYGTWPGTATCPRTDVLISLQG